MDKPKTIYEVPVYCGRLKEFRILNLHSGTVYSGSDDTLEACQAGIKTGEQRGEYVVQGVTLQEINEALEFVRNAKKLDEVDKTLKRVRRNKRSING